MFVHLCFPWQDKLSHRWVNVAQWSSFHISWRLRICETHDWYHEQKLLQRIWLSIHFCNSNKHLWTSWLLQSRRRPCYPRWEKINKREISEEKRVDWVLKRGKQIKLAINETHLGNWINDQIWKELKSTFIPPKFLHFLLSRVISMVELFQTKQNHFFYNKKNYSRINSQVLFSQAIWNRFCCLWRWIGVTTIHLFWWFSSPYGVGCETVWGYDIFLICFFLLLNKTNFIGYLLHSCSFYYFQLKDISPLILSVDESDEITIKYAAEEIAKAMNFEGKVVVSRGFFLLLKILLIVRLFVFHPESSTQANQMDSIKRQHLMQNWEDYCLILSLHHFRKVFILWISLQKKKEKKENSVPILLWLIYVFNSLSLWVMVIDLCNFVVKNDRNSNFCSMVCW